MTARLLLEGLSGIFRDDRHLVPLGARVVIGRSRSCEISAARTPRALRTGRAALESDRAYRRISRRHFQIEFRARDAIHVEDLSTNGLWIGDDLVASIVLDPGQLEHGIEIMFGERELMRLRLVREASPTSALGDDSTSEQ